MVTCTTYYAIYIFRRESQWINGLSTPIVKVLYNVTDPNAKKKLFHIGCYKI